MAACAQFCETAKGWEESVQGRRQLLKKKTSELHVFKMEFVLINIFLKYQYRWR